ncbi:MAG: serine hydrolase domain-containing protein [Pseudomonadales bacterium]
MKLLKHLSSGLVLFLLGSLLGGAAYAEFDKSRLAILQNTLDEYVSAGKLAGGVLYVSQQGKPVVHHAFGWQDVEQEIPMQRRSLHRLASQTKALTSVAVMILQEEGKLLISDPLSDYFPEWATTSVAVADQDQAVGYRLEGTTRSITVRDLLTHTAGINYGWGIAQPAWQDAGILGWYFAGDTEPLRDKVRRMATLPQAAQPGEAFVYGYATDILGALVENISGQTLGAFLNERIFQPLKMRDSYFFVPDSELPRLATVYGSSSDGGIERRLDPADVDPAAADAFYAGQGHYSASALSGSRSYSGGAGAVSTAADYGRFLEMLRAGGTLDGVRILGRKSIELMTTNHLPPDVQYRPGSGFGLGFNILLDPGQAGMMGSSGSYGWGGAYHSTYWVDPEEALVVSYVTQLIPAVGVDDHAKIRALIYQALKN